jgi:hypothetical protein
VIPGAFRQSAAVRRDRDAGLVLAESVVRMTTLSTGARQIFRPRPVASQHSCHGRLRIRLRNELEALKQALFDGCSPCGDASCTAAWNAACGSRSDPRAGPVLSASTARIDNVALFAE